MLNETIEKLLVYANAHLGLDEEDITYTRNVILELCHADRPFLGEMNISELRGLKVPDQLILELRTNLISENIKSEDEVDNFIIRLMGILTPRPSEVSAKFRQLYKASRSKATDYLYDLQVKNNYIQKTAVEQNIHWVSKFDKNNIEITINLSKPEKDNKDIAKLKEIPVGEKYPACLLCQENVGYAGNSNHPARGNLRIIPLKLDQEQWFLQYSPYVYYDRHCIVFELVHEPMTISRRTVGKLLAFVDQFPHFFIGSNSDLPIVGGSILDHEHFQGGQYEFPLMKAKDLYTVRSRNPLVKVSVLDWYNSTFHLVSVNKGALLDAAMKIVEGWKGYENKELDIIPKTGEVMHSTVTPIVRKVGRYYHMYIILRNNRTNEQYPDGIFHAHPKHHAIKKEGIGLIEAMGRFILPARLKRQLHIIQALYDNKLDRAKLLEEQTDLAIFTDLYETLDRLPDGTNYDHAITEYVNITCREILEATGVFKTDEMGKAAFKQFAESLKL